MAESERRSGFSGAEDAVSRLVEGAEQRQRETQHKRDRSWDAQRTKATYDLPEQLQEEIKTVAQEEDVAVYEIARLFLEYGLDAYRERGLDAFGTEKHVKARDYTLFPNS